MSIVISSNEIIDEIDTNFKIYAGPGAGKTYWLKNHVRNVLKNSTRLHACAKVACISYTNVAVDQFMIDLGLSDDHFESSTIHSFLYKNIVKPYSHIINNIIGESTLNIDELKGHVEHEPSIGKIKEWIDTIYNIHGVNYKWLIYDKKTREVLKHICWKIINNGNCTLKLSCHNRWGFPNYLLENLYEYKKLYWKEGKIHHEDVLYFSYIICNNKPLIFKFMSAKYPYLFLDEFQDTTPIQTWIVKKMSEFGSTIGIIGDPAQSIFGFQGASRENFINFSIEGQKNYEIKGNRRNSSKIITLLNHIRKNDVVDLEQIPIDSTSEGRDITMILCEDIDQIHDYYISQIDTDNYCILARDNETVYRLKKCEGDIWEELYNIDSSRYYLLKNVFTSYKYGADKKYGIAFDELRKIFNTDKEGSLKGAFRKGKIINDLSKKQVTVKTLQFCINRIKRHPSESLLSFYVALNSFFKDNFIIEMKRITRGKIYDFSSSITSEKLIDTLDIFSDNTKIRTIHKAKGAEFNSILLYLSGVTKFNRYILNTRNDLSNEEGRIIYVALSRAKDNLFICIPTINSIDLEKLGRLSITIDCSLAPESFTTSSSPS